MKDEKEEGMKNVNILINTFIGILTRLRKPIWIKFGVNSVVIIMQERGKTALIFV